MNFSLLRQTHSPVPGFACIAGAVAWTILLLMTITTNVSRAATPGTELSVMTYNLRYASSTPPNSWAQRAPVALAMLEKYAPDLIGTQEGLYQQVKDLDAGLADYDWIGLGREGGSRGEFMAVFYRRDRLEPLAFDHFWLSDTPGVIGSATWGATLPRMVTWVKFRDLRTQAEFYFLNTHFDHRSQPSREKSAELVLRRVEAIEAGAPVVLAGDFNAVAGENTVYDTLVGDDRFGDTWTTAQRRQGEGLSTFNGFEAIDKTGRRIDWILTRGAITCPETEIITFAQNGQFPSDHFPVIARLHLSNEIESAAE